MKSGMCFWKKEKEGTCPTDICEATTLMTNESKYAMQNNEICASTRRNRAHISPELIRHICHANI
jgi:hypothetical protein